MAVGVELVSTRMDTCTRGSNVRLDNSEDGVGAPQGSLWITSPATGDRPLGSTRRGVATNGASSGQEDGLVSNDFHLAASVGDTPWRSPPDDFWSPTAG